MPVANFHTFETREELASALAKTVAEKLAPDIEIGQFASIALSGGSTPKLFLNKLGERLGPNKEMTYFTLVDERFVPPTDERSNEKMCKLNLGLDEHPESEFLGLYLEGATPEEAAKAAQEKLLEDDELSFDVVTLGMGLDGHTASFFPGADNLAKATDPNAKALYETITADGAGEPRLTLTLPAIVTAQYLVLHIEGAEKKEVFERALQDGDADELPIRHVLRNPDAQVEVYWAP